MIVRMWRGWVETGRAEEYVRYVEATGLAEYRSTPGNVDAQMWTRDLGDGRTEVVTVSWWADRESIRAFAGDDIGRAVFYPEDDEFLVGRETTVSHFELRDRRPGPEAVRDTGSA
ncbi:antibiotic biosynthesis monooxygenase family protein [Actinoplanes sp. CA-252034]|uniref:antibiotic biosynthesis monooxygenase family protein n=1 Tax=Actinoplanes sp. CA-252034 TaxID=3239906 RepID=UPI003D9790C7